MKRIGNLYHKVYDIENLKLADKKARRGKSKKLGVVLHDKNRDSNILELHNSLKNKTFVTSRYTVFIIHDPKEREIYRLPYYPDRIVHHAILNILEPIFVSTFTRDTYSCIKNRGIHDAMYSVKEALRDKENTKYCLKLDIRKFYPSIDHEILKKLLRRKFKDNNLLYLLDEIIDSTDGVPIGNYLSQFFGNFYLTYFDHWIKEQQGVKDYFRYCDDLVIFGSNKEDLRQLLVKITIYLRDNLKLKVKQNYQIFPIDKKGLDFVGYKFYHTHILLRKSIKKSFIKMLKRRKNTKSIASYNGWLSHCNSKNLVNKWLHEKTATICN